MDWIPAMQFLMAGALGLVVFVLSRLRRWRARRRATTRVNGWAFLFQHWSKTKTTALRLPCTRCCFCLKTIFAPPLT